MLRPPVLWTVLLLVVAGVAYLLGNGGTPLFDRDEPRYALTSANMLRSGDLVVPRQYDQPRFAKPPLVYWAQAAAMRVFGVSGSAARFPSAAAMWGVLVLLTWFLSRETDAVTRLLATGVFAFSGLTLFLAKAAITDALLLVSVVVAWACAYRAWRGDWRWRVVVAFGVALGIGLLTKGPVVLGIVGMTIVGLGALWLLDKRWPVTADWRTFPLEVALPPPRSRGVKLVVAGAIAMAIVIPWAVMVEHRSPGFLTRSFQHNIVERTTRGVDGQGRPPGFYLLAMFGTFFPWSMLIPAALVVGWRNRHRPLTRFCLAACIGPWLMFEASTSKMVHWFMPVFVPLSILTGEALARGWRNTVEDLGNAGFRATLVVWGTLLALSPAVLWFAVWKGSVPWWVAGLLTVWLVGMAAGGGGLLWARRFPAAVAFLGGMMALGVVLAFDVIVPRMDALTLGERTGHALQAAMVSPAVRVVMDDSFDEPSVAFYQGGTAREGAGKNVVLRDDVDVACCTESVWLARSEAARGRWAVRDRLGGVMLAKGRTVVVLVLVRVR